MLKILFKFWIRYDSCICTYNMALPGLLIILLTIDMVGSL